MCGAWESWEVYEDMGHMGAREQTGDLGGRSSLLRYIATSPFLNSGSGGLGVFAVLSLTGPGACPPTAPASPAAASPSSPA